MNVNTGELFRLTEEEKRIMLGHYQDEAPEGILQKMRQLEEVKAAEAMGEIKVVPDEFSEEAERLLGEQDKVFVDMNVSTPLTRWAGRQRDLAKEKKNKKAAKQSRKKNRK